MLFIHFNTLLLEFSHQYTALPSFLLLTLPFFSRPNKYFFAVILDISNCFAILSVGSGFPAE